MALDRKLNAWVDAGLIDREAATRIAAHEARTARPVLTYAIVGLGLFAIALGIILLVSANWDRIPDALKLGVHFAMTLGVAAFALHSLDQDRLWRAEGALFLLGALVLAGIALQAQVYQLVGPAWQALLLWLALMSPILLLVGQTRLTGHGWAALLLVTAGALFGETAEDRSWWLVVHGLAMAAPLLLLLISLWPGRAKGGFDAALRDSGLVVLLAGASIAHFRWAAAVTPEDAADMLIRLIVPLVVATAALWAGLRSHHIPRPLLLPLIALPVLATALALAVPHPDIWVSRLFGVLVFAGMWGLIARAAAAEGWNMLFAIAIAAIAIRIFLIYVELFGSLASTGGGLLVGGILVIALALGWQKIVRRRWRKS